MPCESVLGLSSPPLRPQPGAQARRLELPPVPSSVGTARNFVQEALADAEPEQQQTALLLASELVTNAILHARTEVELGVLVDGDQALVCVADRVPDSPELAPQERSRTRPGGRGLALVAGLAQAWGTARYAGGKTVWFLLPVSTRAMSAQ